jgi:hypothetical protein
MIRARLDSEPAIMPHANLNAHAGSCSCCGVVSALGGNLVSTKLVPTRTPVVNLTW